MDRRKFLINGAGALALPVLADRLPDASAQTAKDDKQRVSRSADAPNIILIMTDQQRYDSLPCYGASTIQTPNFDRITQNGVVFEHCYCNAPICTPSRASIMTGKSVVGHGVDRLYDLLPSTEVMFTRRLQQVGYQTALVGKLHVSSINFEAQQRNKDDGFDVYEWCEEPSLNFDSPLNAYAHWLKQKDPAFYAEYKAQGRNRKHIPAHLHMTHWATERTMQFIQQADKSRPFFCLMSLFDPHNGYDQYPQEMEKFVDLSKLPEPQFTPEETANKPYGIREENATGYMGPFSSYTHEQLREMRIGYYAAIKFVDQELGRLLDLLESMKIAENTLVLFTSDHGDMLGDHELLVKGAYFYDPCTRVPLLLRWPARFGNGLRVPSLVQPHDLAATILEAAGCWTTEERAARPESVSLLNICSGHEVETHENAVCLYRNTGLDDKHHYFDPAIDATMIRNKRYKLNVYHNPVNQGPQGELYDMERDPGEVNSLWDHPDHQQVRVTMLEALTRWMVDRQTQYFGSRGGMLFGYTAGRPD